MLRSIERHRRRSGATCVLITHDVDIARTLGDRLDARFGFSGRFVRSTPAQAAASARRARSQGLLEAWILMTVLVAIVAGVSLVISSGVLDNPAL